MSEQNITNKYINLLASMQHQLFVAQDANETLTNTNAEQSSEISSLKSQLAVQSSAAVSVVDVPEEQSPKAEATPTPVPGSSK